MISVVGSRDRGTDHYQKRFKEWVFLSDSVTAVVLNDADHYFMNYQAEELGEILTQVHPVVLAGGSEFLSRNTRGPGATWWLHDSLTRDDSTRN